METHRWKMTSNYDLRTGVSTVSHSVVCLTSTLDCPGGNNFLPSSVNGTIFSCEEDKNTGLFHSLILTSADLLRPHFFKGGQNRLPLCELIFDSGQKVHVQLYTTISYPGEVVAFDFDFNIAVVQIESDVELPTASLMCIDDIVPIGTQVFSKTSDIHELSSSYFKLIPGDEVIVVGRRFGKSIPVIFGSGKYSVDYLGAPYDFEALSRINCGAITNGGPVINFEGNVIGIAFGCSRCTAFLPINEFLKWWNHFTTYKEIRGPFVGIRVANLVTAPPRILEPTVNFHHIFAGVVVEEVERGSPAYVAGIHSNDVIHKCGRRAVRSSLEFSELIWDKKGEVVELMGVRGCSECSWTVKFDIVKPEILLGSVIFGSLHLP